MIADKSLLEFVETANTVNLSYKPDAKARWHRLARQVAKALAFHMGLCPGEFSIRHNKAGIAVSGETTLHADDIYIDLSIPCFGPAQGFMYRSCKGRKDYTGGQNRWMKFDELLNLDRAAAKLSECRGAA
jgi:hypothetical protein